MEEKLLNDLASLVLQHEIDIEKYPELKKDMEDYAYQEYEKTKEHYEVPTISTKEDLDNTIVDGYFQTHYFQSIGQEWRPLGYLKDKYKKAEKESLREFLLPYAFANDEEKDQFNEVFSNQILFILAFEKEGTIKDVCQEAYLRTMLITGRDWVTDRQELHQMFWAYENKPLTWREVYNMKINDFAETLTREGYCTILGDNGINRNLGLTYEGRQYAYQLTKNNK